MNRRNCLKASLAVAGGLILPAGVLALAGRSGTSTSPDLVGFNGKIMGTGYSVRLVLPSNPTVNSSKNTSASSSKNSSASSSKKNQSQYIQTLAKKVHRELQHIDAHMSTWRADSEVSAFNYSRDVDWQGMTPETMSVIDQATKISRLSEGAFDATVGPLVDLWGFGAGSAKQTASLAGSRPAVSEIRENLLWVGYGLLDVDSRAGAIRKIKPNVQIDLSGVAKGHAVDRIASLLDSEGLKSYLVEVGGELRSRGRKLDGSAWRVAIERPGVGIRDVFRILELDNRSVATSGDYRNFFTDGGVRYSHSIDPRTGESVRHQLASVSVVSETTMHADALSTAMMIMGPDKAVEFAKRHNIAAHLIMKSGRALKEFYSAALEPHLV